MTPYPASILYKSIAGRYRPVSCPDGPITACYRFMKNAYWVCIGFMYAYLMERSSRMEDIFKLSGWGNLPPNLTGDKQQHLQLYSYYLIL